MCPLFMTPHGIARASFTVPAGALLSRALVTATYEDDGSPATEAITLARMGGEFDPASGLPLPRTAEVFMDLQNGTGRELRVAVVLEWGQA